MKVVGIDPGTNGAMAIYDTETRCIVGDIIDIPTWFQTVGKRKRKRIDTLAVANMMETYVLLEVDLIVMESVGGRGGESAVGAFAFGYTVGVLYMSAFYTGIQMDSVTPQLWKQMLQVSGKGRADDSAIVARADEMFPQDRAKFRGPRGGNRVDRAEAAMIAKYGGDYILAEMKAAHGLSKRDVRTIDTGA